MILVDEYKRREFEDDSRKWVDPEKRIKDFLDLFLNPFYFQTLMIVDTKFLGNANKLMGESRLYRRIDDLCDVKWLYPHISRACYSHGHMSVVFVIKNAEAFFKQYLAFEYYDFVQHLEFSPSCRDCPLTGPEMQLFLDMFSKFNLVIENNICTFAHDADYLYILKRQE